MTFCFKFVLFIRLGKIIAANLYIGQKPKLVDNKFLISIDYDFI